MLCPNEIWPWLKENVKNMRLFRLKTLAAIVPAAMELYGLNVHALGRSMNTDTTTKHNIRRVDRFWGNKKEECTALALVLFEAFAPEEGPVEVLAGWTDVPGGQLLVFALPRSGRGIPLSEKAVPKEVAEGGLLRAENEALKQICNHRSGIVIVADRGSATSAG